MKIKLLIFIFAFVFMISSVSALTETLSFTTNATESSSDFNGAKVVINGSFDIEVEYLIKMVGDGATRCVITDDSLTILESSTTFFGDYCQISYTLEPLTDYYFLFDNSSNPYTRQRALAFNTPQDTGEFYWITGYEAADQPNTRSIRGVNYSVVFEPVIDLIYPPDNFGFTENNLTFNASLNPASYNLTNATFYLWNSTGDIVNSSFQSMNSNDTEILFFNASNIEFGSYEWNVWGCFTRLTGNTCVFADSNFSLTRNIFALDSQSYPQEIYDTDYGIFEANISVDPLGDFFSASLNYSGELYLIDNFTSIGTGLYNLKKGIDIPPVTANTTREFNWVVSIDVGGNFQTFSSDLTSHNVSFTNFSITGSKFSINYTLLDEETLEPVTAEFNSAFEWFLGTGTETRNISFERNRSHAFTFFTTPLDTDFYVSSEIELHEPNQSVNKTYYDRIFNFREEVMSSDFGNQTLLVLPTGNGTEFIVNVKDSGLNPLENYLVKIYRYYPGQDNFRLVESRETDVFGQMSARVITNDVRYRVEFYDPDNSLVKVNNNVFFTCRNVVCVAEFIVEDNTDYLSQFLNITDYEYTLSFNNNTNSFSFIWNDNRDTSSTHRLEVVRYLFNGTVTVCDSTSSSNIGILSCSVGSQRASYQAQAFRTSNGLERRIDALGVKVGDNSSIFGNEGLIWSLFLTGTMLLLGIFYPPAGIIFYIISVLFLGFMDIVYINPAIVIAEIVIGVLFIWAFRG